MNQYVTAAALFLVLAGSATADEPIPYGTWSCDRSGVCLEISTVDRSPGKVTADAIINFRSVNHRGKFELDCSTGVSHAIGVEGLREDWPLSADFSWLCD